jgi:Protein of unknown function (DUF3224)
LTCSLSFLLCLVICTLSAVCQSPSSSPAKKDSTVTIHAKGTFDVKVLPVAEDKADGSTLGRYSLDKQYHGDLDATAKGEMLTAGSDVKGSGAYVATERVTGTLNGRKGSFVLVHKGTMGGGSMHLDVTVVSDSGIGGLQGIAGTLDIIIADGKHSYDLEYSLPEAH